MRLIITSLLIFMQFQTLAQDFELQNFNQRRNEISKRGMYALGGWAASNFLISGISLGQTEGVERVFHEMNIYWNSINAALVVGGFLQLRKSQGKEQDFLKSIEEQQTLEKILLFNAGLDVAYILGGAYLIQRSKNETDISNKNRFEGFGQSLVLQGGFLFVYDILMYRIHHRNWNKSGIREKLQLLPQTNGFSVIYRF